MQQLGGDKFSTRDGWVQLSGSGYVAGGWGGWAGLSHHRRHQYSWYGANAKLWESKRAKKQVPFIYSLLFAALTEEIGRAHV